MRAAAYVAAYAVLSTCGVLLLRTALKGVDVAGSNMRSLAVDPRFLGGAVLYGLSFFVWLLALRRHELSQIFPAFIGAGFIGVVLGSWVFLSEDLSASRLLGIATILVGVAILLW